MSQTDFGALGGVQKRAQINYESGSRSPDAEYLSAIAAAGVDVLYVLTGKRTPKEQTTQPMISYRSETITPLHLHDGNPRLTEAEIMDVVLEAMHQAKRTLPPKAIRALVDAAMELQRSGIPVNKSAVDAQLRVVK